MNRKIVRNILRAVLVLILATPVLGALGIFPEPTADLYTSEQAFGFIQALYSSSYLMPLMALVFLAAIVLIIKDRMAAAALLITPVLLNILGFHAFLDGGLLTPGAVMGNILLLITGFFLWEQRKVYRELFLRK